MSIPRTAPPVVAGIAPPGLLQTPIEETWSVRDRQPGDLGFVVGLAGGKVSVRVYRDAPARAQRLLSTGRLVAIQADGSRAIGVVAAVGMAPPDPTLPLAGSVVVAVDLIGEIKADAARKPVFQRGVSAYPALGDGLWTASREELAVIHATGIGETIEVGALQLDPAIPATIKFEELLTKHFAVLGSTGVGKSTAVALILRSILQKKADLRVLLIDPHSEYANCFGAEAHVVSPRTFRLPFWLFDFEEIIDVIFRSRPGVEEEVEILAEVIPLAKDVYAGHTGEVHLRKVAVGAHTADTPVPYRISDLVMLLNDRMGRLENKSTASRYHRLITRIETLGHDSRYAFMFSDVLIEDIMTDVLSELFRLPAEGKPITVVQLAGLPTEVIDSVVSVLCRLAFDYGVWSEGASPCLVCCEEAHRYAPADRSLGFGPTRKAISRIAKEGRKYGVFLGAVTQRPADLDATILSQCSTIFAMRLANERDQAIVHAAVPDAGSSLIQLVASLGPREAIIFGEGVNLPMHCRFAEVPEELRPHANAALVRPPSSPKATDPAFLANVVARWRQSTTVSVHGHAEGDERGAGNGLNPALPTF